ncbi:MAG: HAMP domain-containing sensor histidine kinase [Verrucomicrobiota bacterium]
MKAPMKKVALVFVLAVFVPSLVLAWLAVRSLRDEQFLLERQQSLLCQSIADTLAKEASSLLADQQREFARQVESLLAKQPPEQLVPKFDDRIRELWPLAEVGFVVSIERSAVMCPPLLGRPEARQFRLENDRFLCNAESVEVYWANEKTAANPLQADAKNAIISKGNYDQARQQQGGSGNYEFSQKPGNFPSQQSGQQLVQTFDNNEAAQGSTLNTSQQSRAPQIKRSVTPVNQYAGQQQSETTAEQNFSKLVSTEAEFRQLVGDASEGTIARFLQNKLNVMTWYRSPGHPQLVFGAKLNLPLLTEGLQQLVKASPVSGREESLPGLGNEVCVALIDDNARPIARSHPAFSTNWKRPLVASEIGEALPHWEMAVYLLDPAKLTRAAEQLKLTLGLLIALLVLAIVVGGWLLFNDLRRELTLARQKTDFVSNVSHELKTPLTSIRMFAELLAERRVNDPAKEQSYLNIITSEAARLTRLINNVLDFSRMERGEKKYHFESCDLAQVTRDAVENFRPHLEANQFAIKTDLPDGPLPVRGDRDALAQIIVNLLSNAEKYSNGRKEIDLAVVQRNDPLPYTEVQVLDRGMGVPRGCEEKIFEQFFRAHDSLSSGIQGSGLGLTLARKIARAHGGDVIYQARDGGGSCFILRLPLNPTTN